MGNENAIRLPVGMELDSATGQVKSCRRTVETEFGAAAVASQRSAA